MTPLIYAIHYPLDHRFESYPTPLDRPADQPGTQGAPDIKSSDAPESASTVGPMADSAAAVNRSENPEFPIEIIVTDTVFATGERDPAVTPSYPDERILGAAVFPEHVRDYKPERTEELTVANIAPAVVKTEVQASRGKYWKSMGTVGPPHVVESHYRTRYSGARVIRRGDNINDGFYTGPPNRP